MEEMLDWQMWILTAEHCFPQVFQINSSDSKGMRTKYRQGAGDIPLSVIPLSLKPVLKKSLFLVRNLSTEDVIRNGAPSDLSPQPESGTDSI